MVRKARVDANQPLIVATLRRCGFAVAHTHTIGKGFPDLCISRKGWTGLVEVKDSAKPPSARRLTPDEHKFHQEWPGEIFVIESVDDVLKLNERFINEAICKT
jgi:hypothetical protein